MLQDGDVAEDLSRDVNIAKITEGTMLDPFRPDLLRGKTTVMDCIELIEPKRRDTRERLQAVEDLVRYYRATRTG